MIRFFVSMLSVGLTVLGAGMVYSQNYPNKPIRVVTSTVGGGGDFTSRIIAEGISGRFGQPVIVDNRPTNIAPEVVAKATPDGYTLVVVGSIFWTNVFFVEKMPYDLEKDLSPIMITDASYQILVVHPSLPVKTVKELIALAKTRPGELNMGTGQSPLVMELFKSSAGINIVRIPYKGGSAALVGLLGNEVQMLFSNDTTIMTHSKAGRVRALAVASAKPTALAPGLPTLSDSGLPGFKAQSLMVMFAPAKTPATIINLLNRETVRILNRTDVKEKYFNAGLEVVASSPAELAAEMKSDLAVTGKIIKSAGIKSL